MIVFIVGTLIYGLYGWWSSVIEECDEIVL